MTVYSSHSLPHSQRGTQDMERCHRREPVTALTLRRWPMVNVILSMSLVLLGILYLLAVNDLSTKVYEVRSLRNRLSNVTEDTNRIKRETIQGQSRSELTQAIRAYSFVSEGSLEYARHSTVAFETHGLP